MTSQNNKQGFTIIEVVLVLAIAGLIFLMVFVAWPALQRSQRDTQRRDDAARFITQINSYATNNNGRVPSGNSINSSFKSNYLKSGEGEFKDPQSGRDYEIRTSGDPRTDTFIYRTSARCEGEEIRSVQNSPRSAAVQIQLEGSGTFCQDNR